MTSTKNERDGEKIPFVDRNLLQIAKLPFGQRPIGIDAKGVLITEPIPDGQADYFVRDANMRGLALRITATRKTYYAIRKLGQKTVRVVCGEFPQTPLKAAQKKATDALAEIAAGIDPNQKVRTTRQATLDESERMKLTLGFVVERDKDLMEPNDAAGTKRDRRDVVRWVKENAPKVWNKPVHLITEDDIKAMMSALVNNISGATALKCWRYTRAAWGRMPHDEQPAMNPYDEYLKRNKLPVVKGRTGYVPTDEDQGKAWLRAIAAMRTTPTGRRPWTKRVMADYVILSLIWGARRNETAPLLWTDIDFERRFVRFRDTKNSTDHIFALTPGAEAILRNRQKDNATPRGRDVARAKRGEAIEVSPYVFPSERRGFHLTEPQGALDIGAKGSGLRVTMHDLRRTFAGDIAVDVMTGGEDGKAKGDFKLIKLAMNHADQTADITQAYITMKPKLAMLRPLYEAHERRILIACGIMQEPEKVVPSDADALLDALKAQAANNPAVLEQLRTLLNTAGSASPA
ncbi:integrase arm-type DNA-binding domain-containing protein [Burkholderia cenocepacia]|uniref:integrase arm-type DNA-binding domain-containing protein n=1 Tax=Burkholderia cenocepacia TaxID=95486 RepID=UPI002AB7DB93|nr:integrase arm-type DNA-binding domain-containing protein [Burkholderia cenocepacia]